VVSPKKFSEIPDDRVIDDVQRENLAVKFFPSEDEKKDKKVQKIQSRFIELNWMERQAKRNTCQVMGIFIAELYAPGKRTFPAIAASCGETSYPAKAMPKGQSRADDICCFPGRNLLFSEIPECKNNAKGKSSLKNPSSAG